MDRFNFGLDDLTDIESNDRTLAKGVAVFLTVVFWLLSSLTTFLFFSEYASAIGHIAGDAAPILAGIIGVLCLDAGCLAWSHVRSRAATSSGQMTVALVAAVVDVVLALATSGIYILLSTSLETGVRDSAGVLTEFGQLVNYAGTAVLTLALLINFGAVFLWTNMGSETRKAGQQTQLRAIVDAGRYRVDNARAAMTVARTLEEIQRALPAEADAVASRQQELYLDSTLRRNGARPAAVESTELIPSANGHGGPHANFH